MKEIILNLTKDQEALLFDMLPWKYQNMDNPGYAILGQAFWEGYSPKHDGNFTVKFRRFDGASAVILWLAFKAVKILGRLQGNKHAQNWCKLHHDLSEIRRNIEKFFSEKMTNNLLPRWAIRKSDGDYMEIGAQLCTRDGRKISNAVVVGLTEQKFGVTAQVRTDCGNKAWLTEEELKSLFYPPEYISRGGRKYETAKKVLVEFARDQNLSGAQAWSDIDGLTLSRKITSWLNEKLGEEKEPISFSHTTERKHTWENQK